MKKKDQHRVLVRVGDEAMTYFDACARIRDVTVTALITRVLHTIARDQMVAAVLDDDDALRKRARGEHKYRPGPSSPRSA